MILFNQIYSDYLYIILLFVEGSEYSDCHWHLNTNSCKKNIL